MAFEPSFDRPSSVFLSGDNRSLLNWCALGLARKADPRFRWTDVRLTGEALDPTDPLARGAVPSDRLHVVEPPSLTPNQRLADVARTRSDTLIDPAEPAAARQRLIDFLRLPTHTQELLSAAPPGAARPCVVLSNSHRLIALYPSNLVGPIIRAIVDSGMTIISTFGDAAPEGRWAFDTVLRVEGGVPSRWREATLTIEKVSGEKPAPHPERVPLSVVRPIALLLAREFP